MYLMERLKEIWSRIEYKDWNIVYMQDHTNWITFCLTFYDGPDLQKTRKWIISPHMTDSEIIQTIFLAIKTAEEHEMREKFKYNGNTLFGPHLNLIRLDHKLEAIGLDVREVVDRI